MKNNTAPKINLMEVCGTHTVSIAQNGIRPLLPGNVRLVSGPGCPVCVTSAADIDRVIELCSVKGVTVASFGDMIRVPGSRSSLEKEKAEGKDVATVYSVTDALQIAVENKNRNVVFAGVGFETTSPTVAATIMRAKKLGVKNFFVLPMFKLITPALKAILSIKQRKIHGFLLPGHVSAVIGVKPYGFLAERGAAAVIGGFEAEDILSSVRMLLKQISSGKFSVENQYKRAVAREGNPEAVRILNTVFKPSDADWRAIGKIPGSGLAFRPEYSGFDASKKFNIKVRKASEPKGCLCGKVILGLREPRQCRLFAKACTPRHPVGPCMVSSEGACAAEYKYGTP